MRRLFPPRPKLSLPTGLRWRWRRPRAPGGLSTRFLLLTAAFALVAELMILVPSMAEFQERWLLERERAAEVATLAHDAAPYALANGNLVGKLLATTGVTTVAVKTGGVRRLILPGRTGGAAPVVIDLTAPRSAAWLFAPWETLFGGPDRFIRVDARPRFRPAGSPDEIVEIVVPSAPLKSDLAAFLVRTLVASLVISLTGGALVYLALSAFIVRPMRRITRSIEAFRADPENPDAAPDVTGRHDEIGRVEEELARMQQEVRLSLRSRARLAALGEAVAKISHDLRNMLTSAQIASERLAASGDPKVAKALPRLERALDRALSLAQNVLNYGRSEEPPPAVRRILLAPAVEAAAEDAGLTPDGVSLESHVSARFQIAVDPDHLHRILVNLMRNARQAIEAVETRGGQGTVRVSAGRVGDETVVRISDDGPGLTERARQRLFQPFAGSASPGGAGLGLAISRELARANGGVLELGASGPEGAAFELRLPADAGEPAKAAVAARPGAEA
jgi:signal transduction histidine kinase